LDLRMGRVRSRGEWHVDESGGRKLDQQRELERRGNCGWGGEHGEFQHAEPACGYNSDFERAKDDWQSDV
jgi:hypothetical protein